MPSARSLRIIESSEASARLREAERWLAARADRGALIVSASRGAADEIARAVARARGATAGLHRFSFAQLAARLAAPVLAARGIAPATLIGSEAVAARATFDARQDEALTYFGAVAGTPGFPRALARTLQDLAMAGVEPAALDDLPLGGRDLSRLLQGFEEQFAAASATGRAALFTAACEGVGALSRLPLLLLDVPMESAVEFELARHLIAAAPETLVTVPFGDLATLDHLKMLEATVETLEPSGDSDLAALRRSLFAGRQPPARQPLGDVQLFSAPGEGRECVEIARRILEEVARRRAVRRDRRVPAIAARVPRPGRECVRAGRHQRLVRPRRASATPVRPGVPRDSELRGRALVRGPLRRVPLAGAGPGEPTPTASGERSLPPADDPIAGIRRIERRAPTSAERARSASCAASDPATADDQSPIVEGGLRAPWKWERLIVEAAVVGGDPERWRRRLRGLREGYEAQIREERLREDPESPKLGGLERDRQNLAHLANFALPIVETLASWPSQATWGEWLERFGDLAPRVLRRPARVLRVLGELRAMSAIGPVALEEARDVLAERLRTFDEQPPADRYGRVFVGSPHQARGRAFKVVFVPGLAERLFPQKLREDPLLLDKDMRAPLAAQRRGAPRRPGRSRQDRASPAPSRGRRGDRSAVAVLPATRRRRCPSARALVLRSRRHARHRRKDSASRGAPARGGRGGWREAGLARAGSARGRHRRGRARSRHASAAHRRARPRSRFADMRTTCSASIRRSAARSRGAGSARDRGGCHRTAWCA